MLFSVIVPIYNIEKYIRRCIDSVLSQSFTDFELILVDDGSPDKCGEICDEYAEKDKRIKGKILLFYCLILEKDIYQLHYLLDKYICDIV